MNPMSLLGFSMGNFHMRGIMLLFRAYSWGIRVQEGIMSFRCMIFSLLGPCDLLLLLFYILYEFKCWVIDVCSLHVVSLLMMGTWSDDSACWVVHDVRLYSVLDTVVIYGEDFCCSVVFGALVAVPVISVMWSDLMTYVLSCPLWSSVYECERVECEDWVWYVCDVLYAMVYVRVNCLVVRGRAVSKRSINVCNSDVFSVVNMCIDHLKVCSVCMNGQRYICCSECYLVSY